MGRVWMRGFMVRHPELSVRKPQAISIQKAIGFNADKVEQFYDLLEKTVFTKDDKRKNPAQNIYNIDETGLTVVQKTSRTLATKGKKYVGSLTSAEKGKTVTVICCASATGHYVTAMLIFPRARMKQSLMDHCVPGAIGTCTKSGWVNEKAITDRFEHFFERGSATEQGTTGAMPATPETLTSSKKLVRTTFYCYVYRLTRHTDYNI